MNSSKVNTSLPCSGEDIVITGIAGRFPQSDNLDEFKEILYKGKLMVNFDQSRIPSGMYNLPKFSGKIKDLTAFDNEFFQISEEKAHLMDHQLRILLEVVYETIVDSGTDPKDLKGSKTGFFFGSCFSETDFAHDALNVPAYKNIYTTQVSHFFDLKGPIFHFDTACAAGLSAFNEAYYCIKNNICDCVLVAGFNISLNMLITMQFYDLKMISPDGLSKSLDKKADGFSRSEAVVCVFLQKAKDSKRVYGTIVNCKSSADGFKSEGINFPSVSAQFDLMKSIYSESNIDTSLINYVEAHATGTKAGDPIEMAAIAEIFCKNRLKPLKVGCLKSNMGHSEASSGLCSLAKSLLIFQTLKIPKNLNYSEPNPSISSLIDHSIEPVLQTEDFEGDFIPLNCFGFGGSNVHCVLKNNPKRLSPKSFIIVENIPRLIQVCGRNKSALTYILDSLETKKEYLTRDFLDILNHSSKCTRMPYRGYLLVDQVKEKFQFERRLNSVTNKELYLFFSTGDNLFEDNNINLIIKHMSRIDIFAKTIERLKEYLNNSVYLNETRSKNFFTSTVKTSLTESIVSSTALQIGLINIFRDLNINYNGLIGLSFGEIACAYADKYLEEAEAILYSYILGNYLEKQNISFSNQNKVAISTQKTESLINLLNTVRRVTYQPTKNSKWLSSFVQKENFNSLNSLAHYLTHNLTHFLMNEISFESVKANSTLVQIGQPLSLLVADKLKSLSLNYINLFDATSDPVHQLLHCIGQIYILGLNPSIENLYPKLEYPVCVDTPNLSSLIKWEHSKEFRIYKYPDHFNPYKLKSNLNFRCDISTVEDWFLTEHKIDERILFPATGYLMLAWATLTHYYKKNIFSMSVKFKDVSFYRGTILSSSGTRFVVQFIANTGAFVINESGSVVASGHIYICNKEEEDLNFDIDEWNDFSEVLTKEAIYKEFKLRGYDHGPSFKKLIQSDYDGTQGIVEWKETKSNITESSIFEKMYGDMWSFLRTWVTFADSALQLVLIANKFARDLFLPIKIETVICDVSTFMKNLKKNQLINQQNESSEKNEEKTINPTLKVTYNPAMEMIKAAGFFIKGIKVMYVPRKAVYPLLEKYKFVPFYENYATEKADRIEIEKYAKACLELKNMIEQVKNKPAETDQTEAHQNLIQESFDVEKKKYALYAKLCKVLNENENFSEEDLFNMKEDLLIGNKTLVSQYFYKPFISHVIERATSFRTLSSTINVGEINATDLIWSNLVVRSFETITLNSIYIRYFLAHKDISSVEDQINSRLVEKIDFDFNPENFPKKFSELDLVLFSFNSRNEVDLENFLPLFVKSMKPNACLLIIYQDFVFTKNFESLVTNPSIKKVENMAQKYSQNIIDLALENGLCLISNRIIDQKYVPSFGLLFAFNNTNANPEDQVILKINENKDFNWVEDIKKELLENEGKNVWLYTDDTNSYGLQGLVKCLRLESEGERLRCIISRPGSSKVFENIDFEVEPFKSILQKNSIISVYDSKKGWGNYVHLQIMDDKKNKWDQKVKSENAYMKSFVPGDLSSLDWVYDRTMENIRKNDELVYIYYVPLNFKDIMYASGRLPIEALPHGYRSLMASGSILGIEFSGKDKRGKRVMGMVPFKALATKVIIKDKDFLWPVKKDWTLEQASTIPVVYCTAYYALLIRGKLKKYESVLIHCGSGGVGFAAIRLCLSLNCQVFTTVGSQAKRNFLKLHFPELTDSQIFNSRDISFEEAILKKTDGRGVDVILNSLAEEKLQASLRCLADGGRFLEIGKYDFFQNSKLDLSNLNNNKSYEAVHLDQLYNYDDNTELKPKLLKDKKELKYLIIEGVKNGVVKPIPSTIFDKSRIEEAFRFMAAGKHMGKVVIKIRDEEDNIEDQLQKIQPINVMALVATYFDSTKDYLIVGAFGGFGFELAIWLVQKGARNLTLNSRSVSKEIYHHYCLKKFKELNVNVTISNEDLTDYEQAKLLIENIEKKRRLGGVFNCALVLKDAAFKDQIPETFKNVCDSKIIISQNLDLITRKLCPKLDYFVLMSSIVAGRGNPGQSNYGYGNAFMESIVRKRRKDKLHGLAIQWGFIGDVGIVVRQLGDKKLVLRGTVPQRIYSCFNVLDKLLQNKYSVVSSLMLFDSNSPLEMMEKSDIIKVISHILGIKNIHILDQNLTLNELGMDSLMAIEIQQALERDYKFSITSKEIRQLSISKLIKISKDIQMNKKNSLQNTYQELEESLNLDPNCNLKDVTLKLNHADNGKPVFFFPPFSGKFDQLSLIAQFQNRPAFGVVWNKSFLKLNNWDSISAYFESILSTLDEDNYDIVAYSFGGLVALHLKSYLKKMGKKNVRNLVLLDSDPVFLKHICQPLLFNYKKKIESLEKSKSEYLMKNNYNFNEELKIEANFSELKKISILIERLNITRKVCKDDQQVQSLIDNYCLLLEKVKLILKSELPENMNFNDIMYILAENKPSFINENVNYIFDNVKNKHFFKGNHFTFILESADSIFDLIKQHLSSN